MKTVPVFIGKPPLRSVQNKAGVVPERPRRPVRPGRYGRVPDGSASYQP